MSLFQIVTLSPLFIFSCVYGEVVSMGTAILTSQSETSPIAKISLIPHDDNSIAGDGSYRSITDDVSNALTVNMEITNTKCSGIENVEISVYGYQVADNVDNILIYSVENKNGKYDYISFINDWDGGMGVGGDEKGGIFTAPNCGRSELFSFDNNNWINDIFDTTTNLWHQREIMAGDDYNNYDLLSEERLKSGKSPLKYVITNDLINNEIRTSFSAPNWNDNDEVKCYYPTTFNTQNGKNYIVGIGTDQGTVKYNQFDVTVTCEEACEYTNKCTARGDPHITSLDGTYFHFQGEGYFDYVTSCITGNINLPFKISARHDKCNRVASCVSRVIVTLYQLELGEKRIFFPSQGTPTFADGSDATGSYEFVDINGGLTKYIVRQNAFEIKFNHESGSRNRAGLKFEYIGKSLSIESTDCLSGSNNLCGICGNIDGDSTNDFLTCDNNIVLDNTGVNNKYNDIAWENTHKFGESCCNEQLDLDYIGSSDCGDEKPPPEGPESACMNTARSICIEFYDSYCKDCDDTNDATAEWIEGCAYDTCLTEGCDLFVLEGKDVEELMGKGCLDLAIDDCASSKYIDLINVYS